MKGVPYEYDALADEDVQCFLRRWFTSLPAAATGGLAGSSQHTEEVGKNPGRSVETPPLMVAQIPPPCAAGLMVLFSCFRFPRKRFSGFLETVTAAVEFKQVTVMHEPVEDRGAHRVVA